MGPFRRPIHALYRQLRIAGIIGSETNFANTEFTVGNRGRLRRTARDAEDAQE